MEGADGYNYVMDSRKKEKCNQTRAGLVLICETRACKALEGKKENSNNKTMKKNLITLLALGAIVLGGSPIVQAKGHGKEGGPNRHKHGKHGGGLEQMTESLDLTPEQRAKVQPILDQAKPQIRQIHEEAKQKASAVMENTMAQIRPLLTPEQQKKADELRKAHEEMRNAAKKLHDLKKS